MARDLIAELIEAGFRFDSRNYVTGIDTDLLDRTVAELKRLRTMENRARGIAGGTLPEPAARIAAQVILGED